MNPIKLAGTIALALAIGLPTAALASISNQRDSSLTIERQESTFESNLSVTRHGSYVDQRDPSLSQGSGVEFGGFALPERGSRSARFDGEAARAHRQALDH